MKTLPYRYRAKHVKEKLNVTSRQLYYWAKTGMISPDAGSKSIFRYSVDDIKVMFTFVNLVKIISPQKAKKITKELKPFLIKTGLMSLYCCDLIVLSELGNKWLLVRNGCYMSSGILVNIIDYKELSRVL